MISTRISPAAAWPDHWEELRQKKSFIVESVHRTKCGDEFPSRSRSTTSSSVAANSTVPSPVTSACATHGTGTGATQECYRILAEHVDDVIWTADMNLRWTYISPSMEKFRGYSAAETMSQTLDEVLTPASASEARTALADFLASGRQGRQVLDHSVRLEVEYRCKDGSTKWAEINVSFVRGRDSRPAGMVGVTRDITQRRLAEEAMSQANWRRKRPTVPRANSWPT